MTPPNFEQSTYWMLLQVAIRSKHDFARVAEFYDLSAMQIVTLCSLQPGKSAPMSRISCLLVCDASNVTGIVEKLVTRGYIIREESREDRRVKVVQLTAKGEHLRKNVLEEIVVRQPESMSRLSKAEYDALGQLLRKALLPPQK